MAKRGFGEIERRVSAAGTVSYRARYAMPDGNRYSRTLATKVDAEAWLAAERALIDRDTWSTPAVRKAAAEKREQEASVNTLRAYADHYLAERPLRPNTAHNYRALLTSRILPVLEGPAVEDGDSRGGQGVAGRDGSEDAKVSSSSCVARTSTAAPDGSASAASRQGRGARRRGRVSEVRPRDQRTQDR